MLYGFNLREKGSHDRLRQVTEIVHTPLTAYPRYLVASEEYHTGFINYDSKDIK